MTHEEVLLEFRAAGALLTGHFILSSGRRSSIFLQKMLVFRDPARTQRLCTALAARITAQFGRIDLVISPAMGGIIPGYETARALGCEAIFFERENGEFAMRRGFSIPAGARLLMVEDIVTTGLSSRECLTAIRAAGGHPIGGACLIDRSGGRADIGVPLVALAVLDMPDYDVDDLPPELAAIPAVKPGSRNLTA